MKNFFALALAGAVAAVDIEEHFMEHLAKYGRMVGTVEEYNFRKNLFEATHRLIEEHNATDSSFKLGHNRMSDWTEGEYQRIRGYRAGIIEDEEKAPPVLQNVTSIPSSYDWRDHNAVTPVKDQGNCGSCWSFSTTGALEGAHSLKSGTLLSFSEQQLVDCSTRNSGCNGGLQSLAYKYLEKHYAYLE